MIRKLGLWTAFLVTTIGCSDDGATEDSTSTGSGSSESGGTSNNGTTESGTSEASTSGTGSSSSGGSSSGDTSSSTGGESSSSDGSESSSGGDSSSTGVEYDCVAEGVGLNNGESACPCFHCNEVIFCDDNNAAFAECIPGMWCEEQGEGQAGCECDFYDDDVCPFDNQCPDDPDCAPV